ncbi:hypothetical protein ACTA71_007825 [Dictyostelium dimigraforme]
MVSFADKFVFEHLPCHNLDFNSVNGIRVLKPIYGVHVVNSFTKTNPYLDKLDFQYLELNVIKQWPNVKIEIIVLVRHIPKRHPKQQDEEYGFFSHDEHDEILQHHSDTENSEHESEDDFDSNYKSVEEDNLGKENVYIDNMYDQVNIDREVYVENQFSNINLGGDENSYNPIFFFKVDSLKNIKQYFISRELYSSKQPNQTNDFCVLVLRKYIANESLLSEMKMEYKVVRLDNGMTEKIYSSLETPVSRFKKKVNYFYEIEPIKSVVEVKNKEGKVFRKTICFNQILKSISSILSIPHLLNKLDLKKVNVGMESEAFQVNIGIFSDSLSKGKSSSININK